MVWLTAAILFAVAWIAAVYVEDRRREPMLLVALAFGFGALGTLGAAQIEGYALRWSFLDHYETSRLARAVFFLGVVGPVEEFSKLILVWLFIYPLRWFDEPVDGIIYSSAAAIGFATAENLRFWQSGVFPTDIMFYRTPGGPFVHILFSAYWGILMGWSTTLATRTGRVRYVLEGLAWAALAHGLFDILTYSSQELGIRRMQGLMFILLGVSFLVLRWNMRRMQFISRSQSPPPGCDRNLRIPHGLESGAVCGLSPRRTAGDRGRDGRVAAADPGLAAGRARRDSAPGAGVPIRRFCRGAGVHQPGRSAG